MSKYIHIEAKEFAAVKVFFKEGKEAIQEYFSTEKEAGIWISTQRQPKQNDNWYWAVGRMG